MFTIALNGAKVTAYNQTVKTKILLFTLLTFAMVSQLCASENETFSKQVCGIISASQNVKECHYDENQKCLLYQTYDKKEKKVQCLWFPQNESKQIIIDETIWVSLKDVDYVMIGYGLTSSNPQTYYWIPKQKLSKKVNLNKLEKYRLSFPIIYNRF